MTKPKSPGNHEAHATENHFAAETGNLLIDARALSPFLVDLPEGATQGMRREQEGIDEVVHEIAAHQATWGAKAGITADEVKQVVTHTAQIAQIRALRPRVAKLLEMLDETEAMLEDERDTVLRLIAQSVDAKSKVAGPELLAKYEKTRAYRSAPGVKAARTRKKNAATGKPQATAPAHGEAAAKPG